MSPTELVRASLMTSRASEFCTPTIYFPCYSQNRRIFPSSLISTPSTPLQLLCCVLSVRFVSSSFVTLVFWLSFNGPVALSQLRHNEGLCTSSEQATYIYRLAKIKPVVSAPCETTVLCLESGDC